MKKAMVIFKNTNDLNYLIESCKFLKENYGYVIKPVYMINPAIIDLSKENLKDIVNKVEDKFFKNLNIKLREENLTEEYISLIDENSNSVKELLKTTDIILISEEPGLNNFILEILKKLYKPMIILKGKKLSFNKIILTSDNGVKINKSFHDFYLNFYKEDIKKVDVLTWNYNELDHSLVELIESKDIKVELYKYFPKENSLTEFIEKIDEEDLLIMGNLSKRFFLEKVMNKLGVQILERVKTNIFIS